MSSENSISPVLKDTANGAVLPVSPNIINNINNPISIKPPKFKLPNVNIVSNPIKIGTGNSPIQIESKHNTPSISIRPSSPRDNTPITINGKVVAVDDIIETAPPVYNVQGGQSPRNRAISPIKILPTDGINVISTSPVKIPTVLSPKQKSAVPQIEIITNLPKTPPRIIEEIKTAPEQKTVFNIVSTPQRNLSRSSSAASTPSSHNSRRNTVTVEDAPPTPLPQKVATPLQPTWGAPIGSVKKDRSRPTSRPIRVTSPLAAPIYTPIQIPSLETKQNNIPEINTNISVQPIGTIEINNKAPSPRNTCKSSAPVPEIIPVAAGSAQIARPNYAAMSESQQDDIRIQFIGKFSTLRQAYPNAGIVMPPERYTLDQIHDLYYQHLKNVLVAMNCNQWEVYLVIVFLAIEAGGIKLLGLDLSGYTIAQLKISQQYRTLLIELGEKYYVQGGSNWPVEARLVMMALFNAIIFVLIKYVAGYVGGDGMVSTIQDTVNKMLSGSHNVNTVQRDQLNLPIIPGLSQAPANPQVPATGPAAAPGGGFDLNQILGSNASGGGIDGIIRNFSNMFAPGQGGNGQNGFAEMIANVGTAFTQNMSTNQTASAAGTSGRSRQRISGPLFEE